MLHTRSYKYFKYRYLIIDDILDSLYNYECKSANRPNTIMVNRDGYNALKLNHDGMFKLPDIEDFKEGSYRIYGLTLMIKELMKDKFLIMHIGDGYDFAEY